MLLTKTSFILRIEKCIGLLLGMSHVYSNCNIKIQSGILIISIENGINNLIFALQKGMNPSLLSFYIYIYIYMENKIEKPGFNFGWGFSCSLCIDALGKGMNFHLPESLYMYQI